MARMPKCDECRYGWEGMCTLLGRPHDFSCWKPMTDAQRMERAIRPHQKLVGDISTGYSFVNPLEATKNRKEYNKMYKPKTNKQKALEKIKKVIFNDPYTIVLWSNGTKTIVKAEDEAYDPEKGLAMAISKYFFNNQGYYYDVFKKWLPEEEIPTFCNSAINIRNKFINDLQDISKNLKKQLGLTPVIVGSKEAITEPVMLTSEELAEIKHLTKETIQKRCREGKYPGAKKVGNKWMIPWTEEVMTK